MAKFMKDIVHEVLNRNKVTSMVGQSASVPSAGATPTIPGIHRPNYQREKSRERLLPERPGNVQQTERATEQTRMNQLSSLQMLTTAGAISRQGPQPPARPDGKPQQGAQLIGKTRKNQYVWLFPSPNRNIPSISYSDSTGMITGASTHPGTFFLFDQITRELPEVSCGVLGEKERNGLPDVIKIHSKDQQLTQKVLREIYNQLNRPSARVIESYVAARPSRFLLDCFNLKDGICVGLINGVSYVNGIALLDRYMKNDPESSFQFDLRDDCLLITGQSGYVETVIEKLEKDAEKLFS
ncbi:hypothetical protein [Ammoniphilus sp. CFH 90114]|uniref:hypothetical protein n=1 Tax=Ammoniphilus sp. CFH 90114 TaxID=2493665 RepID=UPI00100DE381|nr:hypothetical protein [Ammoniphilus sp. CFH 90114]RXT05771.1 hypothetical protein EIZ39_16845 [Ammoniphilus sp. CFH 90114]